MQQIDHTRLSAERRQIVAGAIVLLTRRMNMLSPYPPGSEEAGLSISGRIRMQQALVQVLDDLWAGAHGNPVGLWISQAAREALNPPASGYREWHLYNQQCLDAAGIVFRDMAATMLANGYDGPQVELVDRMALARAFYRIDLICGQPEGAEPSLPGADALREAGADALREEPARASKPPTPWWRSMHP